MTVGTTVVTDVEIVKTEKVGQAEADTAGTKVNEDEAEAQVDEAEAEAQVDEAEAEAQVDEAEAEPVSTADSELTAKEPLADSDSAAASEDEETMGIVWAETTVD